MKVKSTEVRIIFASSSFFNVVFLLQVVGAGIGYLADRFTYIPYLGLFYVFAFLADKAVNSNLKYPVIAVCSFFILNLGINVHNRLKVWQDTETLFSDVISKHQNIPIAYFTRGSILMMKKKYEQALADFNKAIALNPGYVLAYFNRGYTFLNQQQFDQALKDYSKVIELKPDDVQAHYERGNIFLMVKKYVQALESLIKLSIESSYPTIF
jgi:tetratricopeptide (TPR) repeat protein